MKQELLARLQPPVGVEAPSGWRELIERHLCASSDVRRLNPKELLVDVGEGSTLRLAFEDAALVFFGTQKSCVGYVDENDEYGEVEGSQEELNDLVWTLARPLALALRWELIAEAGGVEYLISETCPGCNFRCFDDEYRCPRCGSNVTGESDEDTRSIREDHDDRAHLFVATLLSRGLLKLASHRFLPVVESEIAAALTNKLRPSEIADLLIDLDGVDDLFADDDSLRSILDEL